jgi:hypothetical protein
VPLKELPKRPILQILFHPDDIAAAQPGTSTRMSRLNASRTVASNTLNTRVLGSVRSPVASEAPSFWKGRFRTSLGSFPNIFHASQPKPASEGRQQKNQTRVEIEVETVTDKVDDDDLTPSEHLPATDDIGLSYTLDDPPSESTSVEGSTSIHDIPFRRVTDLPDSFAPLLSSSHMEMLHDRLTADLIHAVSLQSSFRVRQGRHEIPLDKDNRRPQFCLHVPKGGCRMSLTAVVGSDGFTKEQDLSIRTKTTARSKPMVKCVDLVADPPLPLGNVAPTLIHFPTLFEDDFVPRLRRIQIVRWVIDFLVSMSSFLERCLWIIESKCQVHLSKVRVMPLYRGRSDNKESPEWRLNLAFSGHALLFGWIPVPFLNISLPSFIIPQPHALLEYLLSPQPLASARLKRENIAEDRITLAVLNALESWHCHLKLVATPPAIGVDLTLPGGLTVAMEVGLGRDPTAGTRNDSGVETTPPTSSTYEEADHLSVNSMSSWTTRNDKSVSTRRLKSLSSTGIPQFDANQLIPWFLELKAKGSFSHEKVSVHIVKLSASHEEAIGSIPSQSHFATRGSIAIWKVGRSEQHLSSMTPMDDLAPFPLRHRSSFGRHRRKNSFGRPALETDDSPSVAEIFLFHEEVSSFRDERLLHYDYAFDVYEDTKVDAVTLSIGATHPMLNGGTMVTTILDTIYAFGSVTAREGAVLDPSERNQKRNILRHLPAIDFTFGTQNIYIPSESASYSDDGQTLLIPEMDGGRMMVRFLGGFDDKKTPNKLVARSSDVVVEGIKLLADFGIGNLHFKTEGAVREFPELEIFEDQKLQSLVSGIIDGSIKAHLRPQISVAPASTISTIGKNVFNPLEAYEIDFSNTNLSVKMKEYAVSLGHRRIIFPTESTFVINVIDSIVDMGFEGKTQCELSWDFQGLSPILQVTPLGMSPAFAQPENKKQASLLVAPLRQGRISFHVSSVGGISIQKAVTSREHKEGLYDWKFFNALVSPDDDSFSRIIDVLHDKLTMNKLLQVTQLVNEDIYKILKYILRQIWRAKEIFDQEGVTEPGHVIPMYKMTRLIALFLTGDVYKVDEILPMVRRVVNGEGLDVVKLKDLLHLHLEQYDRWATEIDRVVRCAAVMFSPMAATQPYLEDNVKPLAELTHHAAKFDKIPSARHLYDQISGKRNLPLDPSFSNMVSRLAPYLSFRQVEFILQARNSTDWQPSDLRRIRYVYSIKRKVQDIAESYGGLSFLPQSFLVSVFLGEATRTSLFASRRRRRMRRSDTHSSMSLQKTPIKQATLSALRRKRSGVKDGRLFRLSETESILDSAQQTPAERIASASNFATLKRIDIPEKVVIGLDASNRKPDDPYELGDSLLGPQDVAILLQSGLTSVMKSSTVVQLNQRMLLDLICSQPRSFAIAVLAEIGTPGGQGSPRSLASALMALLELDQTAFQSSHKVDLHALVESWLPGLKIPRRDDYMAGGRWARQSYYEALFSVATSILDDAETYVALKGHVQRVRMHLETDPIPGPRTEHRNDVGMNVEDSVFSQEPHECGTKLSQAIEKAKSGIAAADAAGYSILENLLQDESCGESNTKFQVAVGLYKEAFRASADVLRLDRYSFHSAWFRDFYRRNYDALMILSIFDNVVENVDNVRKWLQALRSSVQGSATLTNSKEADGNASKDHREAQMTTTSFDSSAPQCDNGDTTFVNAEQHSDQFLIDAIIDAVIFERSEREALRNDPLVRLLVRNDPGHYNFVIVSAMGVVTEGKKGLELKDAFDRLDATRAVKVIRADTGTARSFEYNAKKIEDAIEEAADLKKPFGLLGYSQGSANALMAETMLLSGSPKQQEALVQGGGLVCRQLMFSAANGSYHGPASEKKIHSLIIMCEDFFKYQQGYVSKAFASTVLEALTSIMDSSEFHKMMGGANSFLPDGCRAFWREAQHLGHVPTCTLRGVEEEHTTPESLEMMSNLLTKQSGSALHDSQVHVFDAVGYPVYHNNRNGRLLRRCAIGEGAVQRTHHWSPLCDEVEFVKTQKDAERAIFDCAKDRHVFPWVEVNARFGFIQRAPMLTAEPDSSFSLAKSEPHPIKFVGTISPIKAKAET